MSELDSTQVALLRQTVASWPLTVCRYYFIDFVNGNDTGNIGYVDAAPGSTFTPATVQALALKTYERFLQILPVNGAGRTMCCLIRGSQSSLITMLKMDGVTADALSIGGYSNYYIAVTRPSDFTNNATDKVRCETMVALAGPNGDQTFTVSSYDPSTYVVTISAGALTTGTALAGKFVIATGNVTAGAATQSVQIQRVLSSTTFELCAVSTTVGNRMVAGDTFRICGPSVAFASLMTGASNNSPSRITGTGSSYGGLAVVCFRFTSSCRIFRGGFASFLGLESAVSVLLSGGIGATGSGGYIDESLTTVQTKLGLTAETIFSGYLTGGGLFQIIAKTGTSALFNMDAGATVVGAFHGALAIQATGSWSGGAGNSGGSGYAAILGRGSQTTSYARLYIGGSLDVSGSVVCNGITFANATAGCIRPCNSASVALFDCVDGGGNIGAGLDLVYLGIGARVRVGTNNTVTGSLGDVLLNGAPALTWAQVTAEGFCDTKGNIIISETNGGPYRKLTAGTMGNSVALAADPASPADGDFWVLDSGGVRQYCHRIAGTTYRTTLS